MVYAQETGSHAGSDRHAQRGGGGRLPDGELRDYLRPSVFALTMVMVHDVVNPPAASRYYSYAMIGAYDIVAQNDSSIKGPASFIPSYTNARIMAVPADYDYRIAALYCILETGRQLLPSGANLQENEDKFLASLRKKKVPAALLARSVAVAGEVAAQVVSWSKTDHYNKLSTLLRYTPLKEEGHWYPTPPAYIEAVEPHWNTIRPMVIDSSTQFPAPPLAKFSKDTTSPMYKLVREVYDVSKQLTPEQIAMAGFWDCNPFAVNTSGHMMIGFKKISPGGHWMDITGIATRQAGLDLDHAILVHAVVAVTLMDAFISCWEEKYQSSRIRPETYINKYMDVKWQPILQTPPFPEYTSGHSVISTASAEVLTYLLKDHFSYTDNAEELWEIKPRSFSSFRQAAEEAAISRLYGGIHYRDAITGGQVEGKALGQKVIERLRAAGVGPVKQF
jgi:hypothetical protein